MPVSLPLRNFFVWPNRLNKLFLLMTSSSKRGRIIPAAKTQHAGVKAAQTTVRTAVGKASESTAKPAASPFHLGLAQLRKVQVRRRDRDNFLESLAMELSSGLDVLQAMQAIAEDIRSRPLRHLVTTAGKEIEDGATLSGALERTGIMATHVVSLIRIGEESGRLADNLQVVILQQSKEREFRSRIFSAMMYPVFVLMLTLIIGLGVAWFILPRLATVFSQLDVDLPLITRFMIAVGEFFAQYGSIAVPTFLIGLTAALFFVFIYRRTRHLGQWLLFHVPGIRGLMREIELGRMGYIFGTLLDAGLPIVEAIESLADATTLRRYQKFYRYLAGSVSDGNSIRLSFKAFPRLRSYMPSTIQQMMIAGEQSGSLPETLVKIGKNFESKTETSTKNLSVILEPILLVIVWLGVVFVALAVVLPVYSLIGGLEVN